MMFCHAVSGMALFGQGKRHRLLFPQLYRARTLRRPLWGVPMGR
jgi:hypothetical protein